MGYIIVKDFHKTYKRITPWWRFFSADFKQIAEWSEPTRIFGFEYEDRVSKITATGIVTAKVGFIHGASGPTIDYLPFGIFRKQLRSQKRGVCKHDLIYYIAQKGVFKGSRSGLIKDIADSTLADDIIMDGGWDERADIWEFSVDNFGQSSWEVDTD